MTAAVGAPNTQCTHLWCWMVGFQFQATRQKFFKKCKPIRAPTKYSQYHMFDTYSTHTYSIVLVQEWADTLIDPFLGLPHSH